jgi:hypothetical protein
LKFLSSLITALCVFSCVAAEQDQKPSVEPSAQDLMDDMVARLPREPTAITGDIILRRRRGVVMRELKFRMKLDWGNEPATAQYVIMDALGTKLEELNVLREKGKQPQFFYASANAATNVTPPLSGPIQGTDLSWTDLTLSFLWWKGDAIIGKEEIKGRPCYIVAATPPAAGADDTAGGGQYAKVHLWVDEQLHMLLQAKGFDSQGKEIRSLWVKGFKKINDKWMIKDMEIQSSPEHRTKLLINDATETGVKTAPKP